MDPRFNLLQTTLVCVSQYFKFTGIYQLVVDEETQQPDDLVLTGQGDHVGLLVRMMTSTLQLLSNFTLSLQRSSGEEI